MRKKEPYHSDTVPLAGNFVKVTFAIIILYFFLACYELALYKLIHEIFQSNGAAAIAAVAVTVNRMHNVFLCLEQRHTILTR